MTSVHVAFLQFAPTLEPADNLERITALAEAAVRDGASLLVCPEYTSSFTSRLDADMIARAQTVDGPFVHAVAALSQRLGVTIVFGLAEVVADADKFANAAIAVDETGTVIAHYQKAHLYDAFGQRESDRVVPGSLTQPPVFTHQGFTVGLQTCYDLRFPEQSRWLIDAGAEIIAVPAEWVAGENKVHHWRTLITARAIENTCFVVAADHPGPIGIGHSMIVDPVGRELALLADGEGYGLADCDRELLETTRQTNPSVKLRRFRVEPLSESR